MKTEHTLRDNLYVMGDNHGKLLVLSNALAGSRIKEGSDVILLGDNGLIMDDITTDYIWKNDYAEINKLAKEKDVRIFLLRGNHDNPASYKHELSYSNVILLEDLDTATWRDKKAIFIPGAVSIDRCLRKMRGWNWYENEGLPELDLLSLGRHDIVFSHGGPLPRKLRKDRAIVDHYCCLDQDLADDLAKEQITWQLILAAVSPKTMYYGHYHVTDSFRIYRVNCKPRGIDRLDLVKI